VSSGSCERMSALAKKMDSRDAHDRDTFTHTYTAEEGRGEALFRCGHSVWGWCSLCGGSPLSLCPGGMACVIPPVSCASDWVGLLLY
jgi:hypothetical protein